MRRSPRTYVQRVAVKVESLSLSDRREILPSVHECLDVEPQSWAYACNIFIIEFFQYGGLSSIVKAAAQSYSDTKVSC